MKKISMNRYEAPKAELIAIEAQSVLCASQGGDTSTDLTGNGFQFGTKGGIW